MINKINIYLFNQIFKYFFLILFIFLSTAWLLQITRLFTITNFMQVEILSIIYLSLYLLPNILTIIIPFIIIFGLMLCFIKLNNDKELIAIISLGLGLNPIKKTLIFFSIIIILIFSLLNFYFAPKIYELYKIKEYELRNTLDFEAMSFSNFLNLDKSTILDFKKVNNEYRDIFISFKDDKDFKENIIYAKRGNIFSEKNNYKFQLTEGFRISINNDRDIEKLEFLNYVLKISNNNSTNNLEILDKNTLTIFDDILLENYLNVAFKLSDIILIILIINFFYTNNLKNINFSIKNNIYFIFSSIIVLIVNQILKNSEVLLINYSAFFLAIILILFCMNIFKKKYE